MHCHLRPPVAPVMLGFNEAYEVVVFVFMQCILLYAMPVWSSKRHIMHHPTNPTIHNLC